MPTYQSADIRTLALVGHEVAGKTSLADALLFKSKAVDRRGCVDEGTSVSDYDEEEKKQKYSIDTSILHADYQGKRLYVIDCPGKPDFVGQALGGLNAVDTAVIVVSAPSGIQVNTRRMFAEAGKRGLARALVINRLDADNIHFADLVKGIQDTLGKGCVLFNAPVGVGPSFSGVVSVLNPPAGAAGAAIDLAAARSQLIDAIVESDEALMEKYLMEGDVSADELTKALPKAIAAGTLIPIFCASSKKDKDIGATELLDAITKYFPSPEQGPKRTGTRGSGDKAATVEVKPGDSECVGQVFKTLSDKFVGNLSFFRIISGKLTGEQPLVNMRTGKSSRSGGLLLMQGKTQKPVTDAIAGDIVAVAKVEDLGIGDTVSTSANAPKLTKPSYPTPMFGLAVEPKARGDEQKISGSLHKISDEDPTFHVTRDSQTKEMVIHGMSQLHLDVVQHRLKRRFDLEIITHEPKIAYRETITATGDAEHQHKKQSGGRGQYAKVLLRIYPLKDVGCHTKDEFFEKFANKSKFEKIRVDSSHYDADYNFGFVDHIVGGSIPINFIPAVEKGCKELLDKGALAGYRIEDVAVEVYFGKHHEVDSSEAAFKTAGRMAMKKAFLTARPVLLEPIVDLEVTCPSKYTGAILGDLNTKRCRIENQDSLPGDLAVIKGKAPLAEVTRYAAQLGSITQGTGSYTMEFSHYDVVPGNVQQQIVSKSKMAADEDE